MANRMIIEDVKGLKEGVKYLFSSVERELGVFERKEHLRLFYKYVLQEIDEQTVFEPDLRTKPVPCQHKRRDFGWYMEYSCNGNKFDYKIIEPYLCIHCGDRKNVTLDSGRILLEDGETWADAVIALREKYPQICDKAVIEDEINDAILVDREYLRIADYLRGNGGLRKEIELKMGV